MSTVHGFAQGLKLKESNAIGWYNGFASFHFNEKWSIHSEYQWRRTNLGLNWQQSLLRLGVQYKINEEVEVRLGYGWIETFPYGEYPLNAYGKDFTEHRIYQMLLLKNPTGRCLFTHRFMQEQRFVGNITAREQTKEDSFNFLNRSRYMWRFQVPLNNNVKWKPFVALYDEIFIGFGKNVRENVFDQNRLGFLFGFSASPHLKCEMGYLNQIVQLSREVNGKNVFQYNQGIIVNLIYAYHKPKA